MSESCGNCRFAKKSEEMENAIVCRRFPPATMIPQPVQGSRLALGNGREQMQMMPTWHSQLVGADWWCGEYKPAETNEVQRMLPG